MICDFLFTIIFLLGGFAFFFGGDDMDVMNTTNILPLPPSIYHERQEQSYCAVHAVNNIAQYKMASVEEFQEVAAILEATEASLRYNDSSEGSFRGANQDVHGDFSIQVITQVLANHEYSINQLDRREHGRLVEILETQIDGLIINTGNHWFAIKKIGDSYYNLDSTAQRPKRFENLDGVVAFIHRKRDACVFICKYRNGLDTKGE